jgi:TrmH family RNA methyltransferase
VITSTHNSKIKWIRSLQSSSKARRKAGAFVVEGVRLAQEAFQAGWQAQVALFSGSLNEQGRAILDGFVARGVPAEQVTEHVMLAASDTKTPQGILVVLNQRELDLPAELDFVFIPDSVRDPGNLGTMLRTAAAAGVGAVFLPPGTVDLYSPKVVRAAMGAHFRLPVKSLSWQAIEEHLRTQRLQVYLAAARAGSPYTESDLRGPLAIVTGGEAHGAGEQAQRLATGMIHIPMPGQVESLNAAVAAAVLLFEVVRQRRMKPH